MKIKFKINKKKSRIPKWIKVPKTLIEAKPWKGKLTNFVEKKHLNKTYTFEFDEKKKILKSIDDNPKHVHGIYSDLDLKKVEKLLSELLKVEFSCLKLLLKVRILCRKVGK